MSADFFSTLDVQPVLGRAFRPEEERAGSDVVVISDQLWRAQFGAAATSSAARPDQRAPVHHRRRDAGRVSLSGHGAGAAALDHLAEDARTDAPDDDPMTTQRGAHYLKVVGRFSRAPRPRPRRQTSTS